jgi:acid stress chaperone HdeB
MKMFGGVFLTAALLGCCGTAFADDIDLSTWTCQKFQHAGKDNVTIILAWLDGYYRGENEPPVINTDKFVENAKRLGEYCSAHPDVGLITATDHLFKPKE